MCVSKNNAKGFIFSFLLEFKISKMLYTVSGFYKKNHKNFAKKCKLVEIEEKTEHLSISDLKGTSNGISVDSEDIEGFFFVAKSTYFKSCVPAVSLVYRPFVYLAIFCAITFSILN